MEDLQIVEHVVREDPKVIEQCGIIGIPKEDMHKVYCDREFEHQTDQTVVLTLFQHGRLVTMSALATRFACNKL